MKQSILVLGANGFIGREVVGGLASTDWATPILGIRRPTTSANDQFEQRIIEATRVDSVLAAIAGRYRHRELRGRGCGRLS